MAIEPRPPGPNKTTESQIGDKAAVSSPGVPGVDPLTKSPVSGSLSPINRILSNTFVELHTQAGARVDLTPWCQSCNWTLSVSEPWTQIDVTMILPWAQREIAPKAGDWVVIHDLSAKTLAWGMVDYAPSPGIEGAPQGVRSSRQITFRAISWLQLIARAQVFASPYAIAAINRSIGSYFTADDWNSRVMTLADTVVNGELGLGLRSAVSVMLNLRLPPTLGGGLLGEAIRVVYDNATAADAQVPWLQCDPVRGPRLMGVDSFYPASTNLLDILTGMFRPDGQMIEFWETLAPLKRESQATRDALGAVPVLVYRIRPWRKEPLGDFLARDKAARAPQTQVSLSPLQRLIAGVEQGAAQAAGAPPQGNVPDPDATLVATYSAPTWVPSKGNYFEVDRDGIDFPTPSRADSERVNTVTLGLPTQADSPVRFWSQAGLPFMDASSVERYGARLFQPNWPYFPPSATKSLANSPLNNAASSALANAIAQGVGQSQSDVDAVSLVGYIYTVAGLAAMMFLNRERFYRGTFTTGTLQDGAVHIGVPVTIKLPPGFTFVAYTESIGHHVTFNGPNGACNGYMSITYSRGLYNGVDEREAAERTAPTVPSRIPTAKKTQTTTTGSVCRKGRRAPAWPTSMDSVVSNAYTTSLQAWAITRGFKSSWFSTTGSSQWKHVIVSAACARVIEFYWQQQTANAQIRVLSNIRAADLVGDPNGNHSLGASIDFSVLNPTTPMGALQTWGALFALGGNGRLPAGGRGLYLNVSPGGITGTLPTEAGKSSSTRKPAPGGSSAGVHYDYRNAFGFRPGAPANKWLALDTTGDGTDDYMIGGVNSAQTLPYLALHLPTVEAYYQNQGALDPALPGVSDSVPNALQMLGLDEWCGVP